jgi:O-antigen/teichoic acid export membrane protein
LGVVDFGIYNVVGGVVLMFSFLNASMSSATQRFLSFELGKKDYDQFKKVFCMSVNIHLIIAFTILVLAETLGLWFLNTKLVIPIERIEAANWVYQFSILAFMLTIMNVPYNATIIAHERMNVYAYISIVEVVLKLIIVFTLVWLGFDKLKLYAVLVFMVALMIWSIYKIYSKRNFKETHYKFYWDKPLYKTLMSYAGWNLFGNIASVTMGNGINILLNLFFGPTVNAARAIAYQVNSAVTGFVTNFQMALNPQIIKSFAVNHLQYMHQLIFRGAKYSYFLLFAISLPVIMETEIILKLWLKIVPQYTVIFTQLVIVNVLIDCISGTLVTSAQASGKIKLYQATVGGLLLLNLPISYLLIKFGAPPQITVQISIIISVITLFVRLYILQYLVKLSIKSFIANVIYPIISITFFATLVSLLFKVFIDIGKIQFLLNIAVSFIFSLISIYFIGLNIQEKAYIRLKIKDIHVKLLSK